MKNDCVFRAGSFDPHRRNDCDIALAVEAALDGMIWAPRGKVRAEVADGWITLSGVVDWSYQRDAVQAALRPLMGVRSVVNRILVNARTTTPAEVRKEIKLALTRSRRKDLKRIVIDAEDGKVRLRGKVRTMGERDDAGIAAWFAPGVSAVINDLIVIA